MNERDLWQQPLAASSRATGLVRGPLLVADPGVSCPGRTINTTAHRALCVLFSRPADGAIANISSCTRLTHLDLAHNDVSSVGVKQLGTPALGQLQHLDLRNNAQVEKWAVLSAAPHLSRLTGLNLMEISDVRARAFPRAAAAAGRRGAASGHQAATAWAPGSTGRQAAAAAAAAAGGGGSVAGLAAAGAGGVRRPHADIWAALPDLEELWVEAENGFASRGSRGGRVVLSTL